MTPNIHTHITESDDIAGLAQLVRMNTLFNGSSNSPEQLADRLADPRRVETPILAEIEGCIVGFATLRLVPCIFFAETYAEVTELFVEEGHRRQGVGHALMSHAEKLAREAGARKMLILTDFYNHVALSLYRSMGYMHYDVALVKGLSDRG